MKCNIVSLGCPKNLVDSEEIIGTLGASGCEIAVGPEDADVLIVNTCGFIGPALEETRCEIKNALLIAKSNGARLYVYGCAVDRSAQVLQNGFPGVTGWFKISEREALLRAVMRRPPCTRSRLVTTPGFAYLKIADGCANNCTYCTIPYIRGPLQSIPHETVIEQAQELADSGIRELILVAQDTTAYGTDIYGKAMLPFLLKQCTLVPGIEWVRVLYAHPRGIDELLLQEIYNNDKVCKYLDVPIQHINDRILTLMNRGVGRESIEKVFNKLSNEKEVVSIRTTVIAGFPTESEREFMQLYNFLKESNIEWLGVFKYHCESGTKAANLTQVSPALIENRYEQLLDLQHNILERRFRSENGKTRTILVHGQNGTFHGHTERSCPEIDEPIRLPEKNLTFGQFYRARMSWSKNGHLYAQVINEA